MTFDTFNFDIKKILEFANTLESTKEKVAFYEFILTEVNKPSSDRCFQLNSNISNQNYINSDEKKSPEIYKKKFIDTIQHEIIRLMPSLYIENKDK